MALDWSKVTPLKVPIQTTGDDVIFSGHGAYKFNGETAVPAGIEFWLLAPPAASIADASGQALENMSTISMLGLKNQHSDALITVTPGCYQVGQMVPNYVLQAPDGIRLKPGGPHLLGVTHETHLSHLWQRVKPFLKPGKTVRCFWAACTAIDGASNPVVLCK